MAARAVVVAVQVEVLEETSGGWCTACALPAVFSVSLAVTVADRTTISSRAQCADCGATA